MGFIEKLDKLMKEKGFNKSTLAKASDIPYTTIDGFYKKGTDNVKLSTLKKLCACLVCSLDYLTDDNVEEDIIAAHFDGEGYTAEEMEEILQFAEFVKNKRKSD